VFTVTVPTLRSRKSDIPLLVEHFIEKHNKRMGLSVKTISKTAIDALQNYDWPGNVRDIENAVQSAMIIARDGIINIAHLPLRVSGFPEIVQDKAVYEEGLEEYARKLSMNAEKEFIIKTLNQFNNNRTDTAAALKISRKTLFNKMKRYEII
jgi:DNA-binding NtrC family response regulator